MPLNFGQSNKYNDLETIKISQKIVPNLFAILAIALIYRIENYK